METTEEQFASSLCKLHKGLAYMSISSSSAHPLKLDCEAARIGVYEEICVSLCLPGIAFYMNPKDMP